MHLEDAIMNKAGKIAIIAALALATITSIPALARGGHYGGRGYYGGHHHHSRVGIGVSFGFPAFYYPYAPYAYYPPAYYYPPAVSYSPSVYVERGDSYTPPQQTQGYWYYCAEAQAYYPYVKQCAGQWQRVSPQPPG
jgi:hypothetical protein